MSKPIVLFTLAGTNSRLFPFNQGIHKSGLTIVGKPLIVRTVQEFLDRGFDRFVVVLTPHDHPEQGVRPILKKYFPDLQVSYAEQAQATGMGDAVLAARQYLSGPFVYTSGYHLQAAQIAEKMMNFPNPNVVCSTTTHHPWQYGILNIENDLAVGITEKPAKGTEASNQKIQTIYWLDTEFIDVLDNIKTNSEYSFEAALDLLMKQHKVGRLELPECLASLKYPWHIFDIQTELFTQLKSHRDQTARISPTAVLDETEGSIVIEAGAVVSDFAKIVGPAYIGENCLVGDYAFVRKSSLEANTKVGAKTEVVRSVLLQDVSLHYGYLADSVVGNHVTIGAGVITANKRLDRQAIEVEVKNHGVDSGRTNIGALIGDESVLGIRVNLMPGVVLAPRTTVFPTATVYKNTEVGEFVKPT